MSPVTPVLVLTSCPGHCVTVQGSVEDGTLGHLCLGLWRDFAELCNHVIKVSWWSHEGTASFSLTHIEMMLLEDEKLN